MTVHGRCSGREVYRKGIAPAIPEIHATSCDGRMPSQEEGRDLGRYPAFHAAVAQWQSSCFPRRRCGSDSRRLLWMEQGGIVDFSEALRIMKGGGRVRRRWWTELDGEVGDWLEIVSGKTGDGRPVLPAPMVWVESAGAFAPWGGARGDVLGEDWEEA